MPAESGAAGHHEIGHRTVLKWNSFFPLCILLSVSTPRLHCQDEKREQQPSADLQTPGQLSRSLSHCYSCHAAL